MKIFYFQIGEGDTKRDVYRTDSLLDLILCCCLQSILILLPYELHQNRNHHRFPSLGALMLAEAAALTTQNQVHR